VPSPSSSSFFLQHKEEEEAKQEEEEGDGTVAAIAFFFLFFLANATCGQTNKQKKQEKKKLNAYLGPTIAPAWVPRQLQPLCCSKLPSKLLLQAPAPSSSPSSYSKLPCSKLALARHLWSSGDGMRGGRGW